jgi:protein-tyrosine kinase
MEKIKDALAKAKLQNSNLKPVDLKPVAKVLIEKNDTKYSSAEAELTEISYQSTPVIKLNPVHLESNRILSHLKKDENSGVFDSLRTQVLLKMEENNWRTIAVVSPTPESGKTFVSINLAISIAHQPQKTVILADMDLRRPKVATYLGIHTEKSMNDYLLDKAEIQDIIFNPDIPRLVILPTARPVSKSAEILSSKKVTNMIKELRERYDSRIVIFDSPPVLNSDDAIVLLQQVDCILLVVANGMSTQSEIEETLHHVPAEKLLGVVLNRAEIDLKPYYY